ncbi:MAG TPA: tetratricopeptide repeat protein [bacterium]|nr:tetratricopeptide repeat protein [bacterium]
MRMPAWIFLTAVVSAFSVPSGADARDGRRQVRQGNALYEKKRYDEAAEQYQDALIKNPASPVIRYNLGNVLYKKENYEKALEAYRQSLDFDDPLLRARAFYNLGNTLYRRGKPAESIQAYEQALRLNPGDEDAKYNLEFVRNQLNQESETDPQDGQQEPDENREDQSGSDRDDSASDNEEEKDDAPEQPEPSTEQSGDEEESRSEPRPLAMSREDAERLLDALREKQDDLKRQKAEARGRVRVEKDW